VKKFFLKSGLFLLVSLVSLWLLDLYYTNYTATHKNLCEKSDWILNHKDQEFDFAFIGNSRVINMADILAVEKATDRKGINLGLIGANYAENYLVLDQFLKNGNTIKNLLIQVDMHSLKSSALPYPFHNYNYMHLFGDTTVCAAYKDNNPGWRFYLWKYLPFVRYMEFSSRFVLFKMLKGGFECKSSEVYDKSKGSDIVTNKVLRPETYSYAYWTVNPVDEKYFDKLIAFCKTNKINPILYTAPTYYKYLPYQLNYDNILKDVEKKADVSGLPYFNFSAVNNPLCKDASDFNDIIHMNVNGVTKFTAAIIDSIKPFLK